MDYRRIIMGMQKGPKVDINEYCTFIARENGLAVQFSSDGLEYSLNGSAWTALPANTNTPAINSGQTISFRGTYGVQDSISNSGIGKFTTSAKFDLIGSCYTLLYGDYGCKSAGTDYYSYAKSNAFKNLFDGTKVVNVDKDFLFYPSVKNYSYKAMFYNCTELITAPNLPANQIAGGCYSEMFYGCTALKFVPSILPAITLAGGCYEYMFYNCTSLVTAPEMPGDCGLGNYGMGWSSCYERMFYGCTSLVTGPPYLSGITGYCSHKGMFSGCTSLVNSPVCDITRADTNSCVDMFRGCTSLKTTPKLSAKYVYESAYARMFQGCTSLTTAPDLPATELYDRNNYGSMFNGCTSLTNAPALPATTMVSQCYQSMFDGCTSLTNAPALPATTLAPDCYSAMFYGCTSLKTAPALPATTLATDCYRAMFVDCTSLTTAPVLPATTLVNYCYHYMFYGCTNLNYIEAAFLTNPGSNYTSNWVSGVKNSGIFVKNTNASWNVTGINGVPSGWTIQYKTYS